MISLRQPALALHSCDAPEPLYQMKTTWKMPQGATASNVIYWISYAVDRSSELEIPNVVINCHGLEGQLFVGGEKSPPITVNDVGLFATLKSKDIGTLWLSGCTVAGGTAGQLFCSQLALKSGCFVVAADENQCGYPPRYWNNGKGGPFGTIDEFEGTAWLFSPSGSKQVYSAIVPELWVEPYKCPVN